MHHCAKADLRMWSLSHLEKHRFSYDAEIFEVRHHQDSFPLYLRLNGLAIQRTNMLTQIFNNVSSPSPRCLYCPLAIWRMVVVVVDGLVMVADVCVLVCIVFWGFVCMPATMVENVADHMKR